MVKFRVKGLVQQHQPSTLPFQNESKVSPAEENSERVFVCKRSHFKIKLKYCRKGNKLRVPPNNSPNGRNAKDYVEEEGVDGVLRLLLLPNIGLLLRSQDLQKIQIDA